MMIKGRTLTQLVDDIAKAAPKAKLYIGAVEGSGFVFIGTPELYHEDVEALSKHWKKTIDKLRSQKRNKIKDIATDIKNLNGDDLDDHICNDYDAVTKNLALLKKYASAMKNWQNFDERIPKKCYLKDERIDPDGLVILVPGVEDGCFWFEHEYLEGRTKKFKKPALEED